MKTNVFLPSALAIAVSVALVGCGGGGGNSAATSPNVTTPPVLNPGDGNGSNNGDADVNKYNPADYDVVAPDTKGNKVKVGVMDSGVETNASLKHSVQSVVRYIEDYENGTITKEDLFKQALMFRTLTLISTEQSLHRLLLQNTLMVRVLLTVLQKKWHKSTA